MIGSQQGTGKIQAATSSTVRASAALPAAGAWDAAPTVVTSSGAESLMLAFTYTRGAAGGAFDWQLQVSPYAVAADAPTGASEWLTELLYSAGAVAAGADSQSFAQHEYQTYTTLTGDAESFAFGPIELGGAIERVRVRARESGVVGSPGTLVIAGALR